MRLVFGLAAGVMGIALPAVVCAAPLAETAGRSVIERVQADAGTDVPNSDAKPDARSPERDPAPGEPRDDGDGDGEMGSNARPFNDSPEPPGCIYQKRPLDLIV